VKDLDFDEIDRAVNSLKSSSPAENENTDNSDQPTEGNNSTDSTESMPTLVKKRSSGQFMDVVHPSSNMRKAPLISHDRSSNSDIKPVDYPEVESSPESVTPPEEVTPEPNRDDTWPDPIDFHNKNHQDFENDKESDQPQNEDSDIDQINDDITDELNHKTDELSDKPDESPEKSDEMPESPFIAGTKVEKRPLGAFSNDSVLEQTEDTGKVEVADNDVKDKETPETIESNDTNDAAETADITKKADEPLPEELQDNLLSIESGEGEASTGPIEQTSTETEPKKVDTPEAEKQPVAPTSITQQYKEQPSTGDQSTGAIYNTDAYHKPLVKPAKKKASWMWMVWIIILIILGIGVGVAVNQFVIPRL